MDHYLIGSRLWKELYPNSNRCKPNSDWDILVEKEIDKKYFENLYKSKKIELHAIPPLWDYLKSNSIDGNMLFTLKASHVFWSEHWFEKTLNDLFLLKERGCFLNRALFQNLYVFWENKFGPIKYPNFKLSTEEFFQDYVIRKVSHDELHNSVKKFEWPAYKYAQKPNQTTVEIHENIFLLLKPEIQKRIVIEEAQVLGIERLLLTNKTQNIHIAYLEGLKLLIKRLAPLWLAVYIIENIYEFLSYREDYYVERI